MKRITLATLCIALAIPAIYGQHNGYPSFRDLVASVERIGLEPFDLDRSWGYFKVATMVDDLLREIPVPSPTDATLAMRFDHGIAIPAFDAIAPYTATAVGFHSNLGRRPAHERTIRNRNIALLYCTYRAFSDLAPMEAYRFAKILKEVGLDPEDMHESTTDPIGIGNACGRAYNEARNNDGLNTKGDIGARSKYFLKPFRDYTGYKPVNSPDELIDPTRWQPAVVDKGGIFRIQKYVTPQLANVRPYTFSDMNQFQTKPHGRLMEGPRGMELYKKSVDEIIAITAGVTDEQKMAAEIFSDKHIGIPWPHVSQIDAKDFTDDQYINLAAMTKIASFDALIAIWKEKTRWDAVRPFSAIQYVYKDRPITGYCGPEYGVCNDLPASDWESYLTSSDHPEYPSGTAGLCSAEAEIYRLVFGDDMLSTDPVPFARGSSMKEPGFTPKQNMTINFASWTDFEMMCGSSRLWGGIHFVDAVEEGQRIGKEIAKLAVQYVEKHIHPERVANDLTSGPMTPFRHYLEAKESKPTYRYPKLYNAQ